MDFNQYKTTDEDSDAEEGRDLIVLRNNLMWMFIVAGLGLLTREAYLRHTGEELTTDIVYWYLFVEHQAVSMPVIVVAMATALLVDHIRARRNPALKLRVFWKVIALFSLVFAGYISIHGI